MEKERKIFGNLSKSEIWFKATFEGLRKLCDKKLHQIDFKDYRQLYSVIKSARDCDFLLSQNVTFETQNLVGAAKNLYGSLQGAKFLFDVKNLTDFTTGFKDLNQLMCLYKRASELDIQFEDVQTLEVAHSSVKEGIHGSGVKDVTNKHVLAEFCRLGKVALEFNGKFGSHSKCIESLEKFEGDKNMHQMIQLVERLQLELAEDRLGNFAISTEAELRTLNEVRKYIQLN